MTAEPLLRIVRTSDRPDLVATSVKWRWEEFAKDRSFDEMLAKSHTTAITPGLMPQTLVLLADDVPVGTASLVESDLEERPDLTPWLAGVVVASHARGQGYAARLVTAIEERAAAGGIRTLWLYTRRAERVYARAGWVTVEIFQRDGHDHALMRRDL